MKRFFSRQWQLREDAMKVIISELGKSDSKLRTQASEIDLLHGCYGLIANSLPDKLAQVATQGFTLLNSLSAFFKTKKAKPSFK